MYNRHPAPGNCHDSQSQDLSPTTPGTLPFDQSREHFRRGGMGHRPHCPVTGTVWLLSNTSEVTCWPAQEKSNKSQISCWHGITLLKTWTNLLNRAVNTYLKPTSTRKHSIVPGHSPVLPVSFAVLICCCCRTRRRFCPREWHFIGDIHVCGFFL